MAERWKIGLITVFKRPILKKRLKSIRTEPPTILKSDKFPKLRTQLSRTTVSNKTKTTSACL